MPDKTLVDYLLGGGLALCTAAYTAYRAYLQGARVSIDTGDRMSVVRGPGGARRIHLRCALRNQSSREATLHRLEATITGPDEAAQRYLWNEFFEFAPGTTDIRSTGIAHPVPLAARAAQKLWVQLELTEPNIPARWIAGRHRVEVLGWVNRQDRTKPANLKATFNISVSVALAAGFSTSQPVYAFEDIPIDEWSA